MKRSSSRRSERLGDQILRELSLLLMEEVKDPRVEHVTLTGVRLNADLRIAEVLFTAGEDQEQRAQALQGLTRAAGFLRGQLGRRLSLKYLPELRFIPDDFLEDMVYAHSD